VNVNVKRNIYDTSIDVHFSPNLAMAALRYGGTLPMEKNGKKWIGKYANLQMS